MNGHDTPINVNIVLLGYDCLSLEESVILRSS